MGTAVRRNLGLWLNRQSCDGHCFGSLLLWDVNTLASKPSPFGCIAEGFQFSCLGFNGWGPVVCATGRLFLVLEIAINALHFPPRIIFAALRGIV
jgi:hypothetical protein